MQLSSKTAQVSDNIFTSDDAVEAPQLNTGIKPIEHERLLEKTSRVSVEQRQYQPFNFDSLPQISDIDIPFFNRLSDMLSVVFPQVLNDKFNIQVEIESLKSQVVCYRCFNDGLASDSFVVQSQCLTWNTNFLISFSRKFINNAMNEYLSLGSSLSQSMSRTVQSDKPLSRMGQQFTKSVSECCFESINQILQPHLSLNMLTRYVENNIEKAVLVEGREKVVVCKLMARIKDQAPRPICLVFPLSTITPYLDELDKLANLLAGQLDDETIFLPKEQLKQIPFELVAATPEEQVPLQQVTQMKVGDIIPLPNFNQLEMKIIDEVIFKASLGSDGAYHAGLITQKCTSDNNDVK